MCLISVFFKTKVRKRAGAGGKEAEDDESHDTEDTIKKPPKVFAVSCTQTDEDEVAKELAIIKRDMRFLCSLLRSNAENKHTLKSIARSHCIVQRYLPPSSSSLASSAVPKKKKVTGGGSLMNMLIGKKEQPLEKAAHKPVLNQKISSCLMRSTQ